MRRILKGHSTHVCIRGVVLAGIIGIVIPVMAQPVDEPAVRWSCTIHFHHVH